MHNTTDVLGKIKKIMLKCLHSEVTEVGKPGKFTLQNVD